MINVDLLLEALDPIKHCGDYGVAWVNQETGVVLLTMGDSDGVVENGYTSFEEIVSLVMAEPNVKQVIIADEHGPDDDVGWLEVGNFGQEWYRGKAYPRRVQP